MSDGSTVAAEVNATSFSVGSITSSQPSSNLSAATFQVVNPPGTGQVDGWGRFNLTIDNNATPNGISTAVNQIASTITDTSGTWASAADVLTGNASGHMAAAHIYVWDGTYTGGAHPKPSTALGTGFATNGGNQVPIPPTALLLGTGLLGLVGLGWRRRKDS